MLGWGRSEQKYTFIPHSICPIFSLVPNSRAAGWWTGDWAVEIRRYCGIHSSFNLPSKDRNSDQTVWSICIGVSIASKDHKSDQIFKQVGIFNSWFTTRASRRTRHLLPKNKLFRSKSSTLLCSQRLFILLAPEPEPEPEPEPKPETRARASARARARSQNQSHSSCHCAISNSGIRIFTAFFGFIEFAIKVLNANSRHFEGKNSIVSKEYTSFNTLVQIRYIFTTASQKLSRLSRCNYWSVDHWVAAITDH